MGVYYGMNGLWVPVGGQGGAAPIDPNLLAENIKSGITISGITGTFTNDGTATASDIASGATAYVNGKKITGNITTTSTTTSVDGSLISLEREPITNSIYAKYTYNGNWLFRNGATLTYPIPASNFGDATAADVASGKTFTSSAGLKVTGTNPKIVAETIENNQNSAESTQNRSIRWISHPLSGAEKARCARARGRGG